MSMSSSTAVRTSSRVTNFANTRDDVVDSAAASGLANMDEMTELTLPCNEGAANRELRSCLGRRAKP